MKIDGRRASTRERSYLILRFIQAQTHHNNESSIPYPISRLSHIMFNQ
jgi:hypothetical protein